MPKRLNRPTNDQPPYPWRDYILGLEDKIRRLQSEVDGLQSKLQQPSLFGGDGGGATTINEATAALFEGMEPGGEPGGNGNPDENRLGGFTADSDESRKAAIA